MLVEVREGLAKEKEGRSVRTRREGGGVEGRKRAAKKCVGVREREKGREGRKESEMSQRVGRYSLLLLSNE